MPVLSPSHLGPSSRLLCYTPSEAWARKTFSGFDPRHQTALLATRAVPWVQACQCLWPRTARSLEYFVGFCWKAAESPRAEDERGLGERSISP